MTLLLAFFFLAILVSFACSIWEAVLLSITPSYVTRANSEGRRTGKLRRGEGTLGRLIQDEELYEELRDGLRSLTAGAGDALRDGGRHLLRRSVQPG